MKRPRRHYPVAGNHGRLRHRSCRLTSPAPNAKRDELDILAGQLHQPIAAPDLTRSIMGRLGYMRLTPAAARRRRVRRWMARGMMMVMALSAVWFGVQIRNAAPDVRRPAEMTIPAALSHDLHQHQQRFNSAWRTLRQMTPPLDRADEFNHDTAPASMPDAIDARDNGLAPGDRSEPDIRDSLFDEDVNRSAIAPVRWI